MIEAYFPVHLIQIVIIDDHKDRAYAEFHGLLSSLVHKALIKRISSLVSFKNWAKNGEILNLNGSLLMLDHVLNALCNATPHHVEETSGLSLSDLERIISVLSRRISFILIRGLWILDKRQIELREILVKEARILDALLEKCIF